MRRRSPRGLILLYHRIAGPRSDPQQLDVSPPQFAAHLDILARHTEPLGLEDFERRRRAGTLPARAVAVTFDDGYADNLHAAAPLLAAKNIAATVFVTAGMVGSSREFWWDDIERIAFVPYALAGAPPLAGIPWTSADGEPFESPMNGDTSWTTASGDFSPRHRLYRELTRALRLLPDREREPLVSQWREWAGIGENGRVSHRALSASELMELSNVPGLTIGAHTLTHPSLAALPAAEQMRELSESRFYLAQTIGKPVDTMAYPYGESRDVSDETVKAAQRAGYAMGLANVPGSAWRFSSRWQLPRMLVRDWGAATFAARLDAWFDA